MLSNAYFLAKFRFDTAENEPAKNLQNFAKIANFADPNPLTLDLDDALVLVEERGPRQREVLERQRALAAQHERAHRQLRGGPVQHPRLDTKNTKMFAN